MSAADKAYAAAVDEIARVREAGGTRLDLSGAKFRALDRLPDEIAGWDELVRLDLRQTQIRDAGLAQLAGVAGLQSLWLNQTQISDAGLAHLAGLAGLQRLDLTQTQISDAGLAHLAGLAGLQWLGLSQTQISDAGLAHLAGMAGLQSLSLSHTQISDAGLAHLAGMAGLRKLDLENTKITRLDALSRMKTLKDLDVGGTGVRDLRPICDLPLRGVGFEWGMKFAGTPAAALDPKLLELAGVKDNGARTKQTLAYLRGLPQYPAKLAWLEEAETIVTLDAILSAQTPLGWKFSPAHGAMVVYIEETPLDAFQSQMAKQTALRAQDLKKKVVGANFGVRGDVAGEVDRLIDILGDESRSLAQRSYEVWASLIALGGHLDSHDRSRYDGRDPLDLLSADQRTALNTLLTIAGNFVRSFAQIKEMDEGAGSFLRREVTLDMVAQMIEQALQAAFVAQQSAALMQHVAGVAKGTGGQADKATSVTVRGIGNLITSASMVIGKPVAKLAAVAALGMAAGAGKHVGEGLADNYELEKPAIEFIDRIAGIAPELIDVMPADEAAQVRAALRDAQEKIEALRAKGDLTRR